MQHVSVIPINIKINLRRKIMKTIQRKMDFFWPLFGSSNSARLLRVLLPLIVVAILIQGFLDETITQLLSINHALFTALLSLIFASITAIVIIQLSRIIFHRADKAEIERRGIEEKNLQLASIIESSDDAIIGKSLDGTILSWNSGAERMYGYTKEEALHQPISLIIPADYQEEMTKILEMIRGGQRIAHQETIRQKKDGKKIDVSISISPIYNSEGTLIGASTIARDMTEQRRANEKNNLNEVRLESLLKISQHQTESKQELLDFALSEAITLTGSKIGYIYFYDENKKEFTLNSWSTEVMKECKIIEQQTIYQLEKTGLWGEAVRQKKPIIVNDFHAVHPLKKGYPEGHAPLFKYLTIPVVSDKKIVAVVGVANKEIDYNDTDVRQLTLLMDNVWQITERQRAENELRKLSRVVEQSPASIVITDTSGAIEYVNPKFVQLTGYSLEEAIGKNPRILKSGEKASEEYKQLWDLITTGSEWRGEFHNKKKNGELYWESAVISPISDARGVITHFLAVKEDITEQKQTEQALQYEKNLLRTLIDNIPDTIYSKDLSCRKTLANSADLKNMRVQSEAEIIGKDDFAFYSKEMAQDFYNDDQQVLMTGKSVINKEECIVDEHGEKRWLLTNKLPLRDKAGTIIGLAGVGRDITDRKRAEEAIRKSEKRFRNVWKNSTDGMRIIDENGTILEVNQGFCRMMKKESHELVGQPYYVVYAPLPPEVIQHDLALLKKRMHSATTPNHQEFSINLWDGSERWFEATHSLDLEDQSLAVFSIFRDITDRKQAEEKIHESEEKFRAIFEQNSSAIAIIEPDTTISMVNDAYCQISGYTKQEVVGMSWTSQIPPDDLERLKEYNRRRLINPQDAPENYEFKFYHKNGEVRYGLISVSFIPTAKKIITSFVDITDRRNAEMDREKLINELKSALSEVKTLSGLLPICSSCKKIRDDNGYWQQVEGYIQKHSDAKFTHGICPECTIKYFPEYAIDKQKGFEKK
jgi:PAS domain S-box-containing protein